MECWDYKKFFWYGCYLPGKVSGEYFYQIIALKLLKIGFVGMQLVCPNKCALNWLNSAFYMQITAKV